MANHGPSYGLSYELQLKNEARFRVEEARETLAWVADVADVTMPISPTGIQTADDVACALRDGTTLCLLAERLGAGRVNYTQNPRMPFHMMENISQFLGAIREYGVPEISTFQTVDLYEAKQIYKVVECLRALASVDLAEMGSYRVEYRDYLEAQKKKPGLVFPPWVVKMSEERRRNFSPAVLSQSNAVISLQMGTNSGASQKGMTPYGAGRQIIHAKPNTPSP